MAQRLGIDVRGVLHPGIAWQPPAEAGVHLLSRGVPGFLKRRGRIGRGRDQRAEQGVQSLAAYPQDGRVELDG